MKKDYTVLLIQLDGKLSSHQVESREPCNLSSIKIILIISLLRELTTPCVHLVDIIIIYRHYPMLFILILFCRFIYLNELNEGQINAYMRNGDNTLTLVQVCDDDKSLS